MTETVSVTWNATATSSGSGDMGDDATHYPTLRRPSLGPDVIAARGVRPGRILSWRPTS